ncbi:MAG TPA: hypothetical protein VM658_19865 [bacterium]|nr:hypothetical protein [bacterium]
MENVMVETDDYNGRYVALKSFEDHTVMGSGLDPAAAFDEARAKGCDDPIIVYIDDPNTVNIY